MGKLCNVARLSICQGNSKRLATFSPSLKGVVRWENIFRCACFDYDNVNDDHVQGQSGRGKHLYQKDMRRKRKRGKKNNAVIDDGEEEKTCRWFSLVPGRAAMGWVRMVIWGGGGCVAVRIFCSRKMFI